jgi:molybdate transport system regulatory protein
MNQIKGTITAIETAGDISLVTIAAGGESFSSLVLDTPATATYLQVGKEIVMVFKETEMSIGKDLTGGLSLRNRFPGTVKKINAGRLLSSVLMDFNGQVLEAVITTRAVAELRLAAGDGVVGLVKTNEISLTQKLL